MKNSILLLIFFFTISCSSNNKDVYKNDKSLYENNLLKDYELFKLANDYINTNQFKLALVELNSSQVTSFQFASIRNSFIHLLRTVSTRCNSL